jgi:hypothetical protein
MHSSQRRTTFLAVITLQSIFEGSLAHLGSIRSMAFSLISLLNPQHPALPCCPCRTLKQEQEEIRKVLAYTYLRLYVHKFRKKYMELID